MTEQPKSSLYMCIGFAHKPGESKKRLGFIEVSEAGALLTDEFTLPYNKNTRNLRAGAVYRMYYSGPGKMYTGGDYAPQFIKMLPDEATRRTYQLRHEAIVAKERAHKMISNDLTSALDEAVRPLADAYRSTDSLGKRVLEALLLERLRNTF